MNQELKAKWVAALRSGDYEQGTGTLNVNDKFCCLGVLAEVAGFRKEVRTETKFGSEETYTIGVYFEPVQEGEEYGSTGACGYSTGLSNFNIETLWKMNDRERKSFKQIADWIEANDI